MPADKTLPPTYNATTQRWLLWLKAHPKAHKTQAYFDADSVLHLKVAAPPIEGEANKAIIHWLSKQLNRPKQAITLLKGETAALKCFEIQHISSVEVALFLQAISIKR